MAPFTRWQRFVARLLPWFDPDEVVAHDRRTDKLVTDVSRIESVRIGRIEAIRPAYSDTGNRLERKGRRAR